MSNLNTELIIFFVFALLFSLIVSGAKFTRPHVNFFFKRNYLLFYPGMFCLAVISIASMGTYDIVHHEKILGILLILLGLFLVGRGSSNVNK